MNPPNIREAILNTLNKPPSAELLDSIAKLSSFLETLSSEMLISVSEDLSAISLKEIPLIFMGSNYWWIHRFFPPDLIKNKASNTAHVYSKLSPSMPRAKAFHIAIPEKDTICFDVLFKEYAGDIVAIKESTKHFVDSYSHLTGSQPLLFQDSFLSKCRELDFSYFDSHLPTQLYLLLANQLVKTLGGPDDWMDRLLPLHTSHKWLDLGKKLSNEYSGELTETIPAMDWIQIKESVSNVLSSPLRDTKTGTINRQPILDMKVLILGDSHSSIVGGSKLTDIIASVFREVDFAWNPYGIHGLPPEYASDTYDVVISEISERFIYGIP
jgi:hypothetical protein